MSNSERSGCRFLLSTGFVIVLLLTLNGLFVRIFFRSNLSGMDDRAFQAMQFLLPVLMIFIEFWFYDWWTFFRKRL